MRASPDHGTWVVLSDRGILDGSTPPMLIDQGLFVLELALPLQDSSVLFNHQTDALWPRTLALFCDPIAGIALLHRQGDRVVRHHLPGPLPQGRGTARLSFQFDAPARHWSLSFETLGAEHPSRIVAQGRNPLPLLLADLQAICIHRRPDSPVLWFGLTRGTGLPDAAAWIGLRTPIETPSGPVAAGNLKPGDLITTLDHGNLALQGATRMDLPARGSFAPVLLRAPYFAATHDLLVSGDQMIAISGPEAEYLFGDDAVLLPASTLVDGRTALSDQRRAVTGSVVLDFGTPAIIEANGCLLAIGQNNAPKLPLRVLQHYEALTLMALLGRMPRRAA